MMQQKLEIGCRDEEGTGGDELGARGRGVGGELAAEREDAGALL